MSKYQNKDKLEETKIKVDQVTEIMRKNVQQALDNSDQIQDLELGSEDLLQKSKDFERDSRRLKWKMCRQYWKSILCIVLCIACLIGIIVAVTNKNWVIILDLMGLLLPVFRNYYWHWAILILDYIELFSLYFFCVEYLIFFQPLTYKIKMSNSNFHITSKFEAAKEWIDSNKSTLKDKVSQKNALYLYSHYKQATIGDNNQAQPWMLQLEAYTKWNAWTALKGMSKETAQVKYVEKVDSIKAKLG